MFHTYVTLIQTVYRAMLTSAVLGIGHQIHTPKKIAACCYMEGSQIYKQFPKRSGPYQVVMYRYQKWMYAGNAAHNADKNVAILCNALTGRKALEYVMQQDIMQQCC